jgi:hypothetical protein
MMAPWWAGRGFGVATVIRPCTQCGQDTRFVDYDFQTYVHAGDCAEKLWREYVEATCGPRSSI